MRIFAIIKDHTLQFFDRVMSASRIAFIGEVGMTLVD